MTDEQERPPETEEPEAAPQVRTQPQPLSKLRAAAVTAVAAAAVAEPILEGVFGEDDEPTPTQLANLQADVDLILGVLAATVTGHAADSADDARATCIRIANGELERGEPEPGEDEPTDTQTTPQGEGAE